MKDFQAIGESSNYELINFLDTKAKCRRLKKQTCKGTLRQVFIRVYNTVLCCVYRKNAWSVQISRENYSEHDVANVLKRFVRQLQEPLLTTRLRAEFIQATRLPLPARLDR